MLLKLSYLDWVVYVKRRRVLGACFEEIKKTSLAELLKIEREEEIANAKRNKFKKYVRNKLHFAFNRWRINVNVIGK
jgi:hypothetical protein